MLTDTVQQIDTGAYANFWSALGLRTSTDSSVKRQSWLTDLWVALSLQSSSDSSAKVIRRGGYINDRRRHRRHAVGRKWSYRIVGEAGIGPATLYDISQSGISLGSHRGIAVGQPIPIRIEAKGWRQLSFIINATVVRDAGMTHDGIYRYGCVIDSISDSK